ncbi:MAG: hypothetical protein WAL88_07550 [Nitrosotalea sp.]
MNINKPFLWSFIEEIDAIASETESWERITLSANEENESKTIKIIYC